MTDQTDNTTYKDSKPAAPDKTALKAAKRNARAKRWSQSLAKGGMRLWFSVMLIYLIIFAYVGFIAFWPMDFNDPDNTVKKYLTILEEYETKNTNEDVASLKGAIEELMKKAEESAQDMQQLASQSFNIVLGAFLAFLSATVTMLFQGGGNKDEEPEEVNA